MPAEFGRGAAQRPHLDRHPRRRAVLRPGRAVADDQGRHEPQELPGLRRYPRPGAIHYTRTIKVSGVVAAEIRQRNAVLVVHGIDYNDNGLYDGTLDRSELDRSLTGESTAPALCGPLVPGKQAARSKKTAEVPPGSGGGETFTATFAPGARSLRCVGSARSELRRPVAAATPEGRRHSLAPGRGTALALAIAAPVAGLVVLFTVLGSSGETKHRAGAAPARRRCAWPTRGSGASSSTSRG